MHLLNNNNSGFDGLYTEALHCYYYLYYYLYFYHYNHLIRIRRLLGLDVFFYLWFVETVEIKMKLCPMSGQLFPWIRQCCGL